MSDPRLSKRESSTGLRRESLAPNGRKRSGSNASGASRSSLMFTSPAKGFGLARKASTATLSVAAVSTTNGIDHKLEGKDKGLTDKARPVRQATRAQDALRSVQTRVPVAPQADPAPILSESPKAAPAPLPDTPPPSTSPSRIPIPTSRASLIPVFRGSPERSKTTANGTAPTSSTPNKSPPAPSKFRSPTMTPSRGLTRKPSTTSIRSTTGHRPISSSPLASKSTPTPTPALPKLDTASVTVPPVTALSLTTEGPVNPVPAPVVTSSPTGTSWLSTIRGITGSSSKSPAPGSGTGSGFGVGQDQSSLPAVSISESPVGDDSESGDKKSSPGDTTTTTTGNGGLLHVSTPLTTKSSNSTLHASPTHADYATAPVSPVSPTESESALVIVDVPASPIDGGGGVTINSLAAQHAAGLGGGYGPASWLAWMSSSSPVPTSPLTTSGKNITEGGEGQGEVMDIGSEDEVMSEDYGRTPDAVVGSYEGQRGYYGWGWSRTSGESARDKGKGRVSIEGRASGEGRATGEDKTTGEGKGKEKRPPMHATALSVDSVVPPVPESDGEGEVPARPALTIKPVTQNTLNLNATALRYALQLPLLGRSKPQAADSPGGISERSSPLVVVEPNGSQGVTPGASGEEFANPPNPGMIVTRYSDDHDFVIVEIEVDGWILINTEGTWIDSPSTPLHATRRPGTSGNTWWDYYIGRTHPGPAAPDRVDTTGPAAEMAEGLSSPARSTEVARDADSVDSSLFNTVLRPFGRGKAQTDGSTTTTTPQDDARERSQPPKTQAELIKEEALARQSPSVVPGLPSPVLNTATRSSWVSYFSSKASRSTPAMADGRAIKQRAENAGEMEVMDIDEEDLSEPIEVQTSNPDNATSTVQTRTTPVNAKPASPLTDSPSVKRKASIISQGKQSSASSSRSAKVSLPNLVLPAFGDTFYTIPRCMPPRVPTPAAGAPGAASAGSWKLKRTVKNLSTMLFNTNASDKALGPNVANAEMEEYQRQAAERHRLTNRANFAVVEPALPRSRTRHPRPGSNRSNSSFGSLAIDDFGHQLPRVFSVLDQGNALGDIAGPIRAVVIGVHGWFPGPLVRSVFGEPTGTSVKFATMGVDAVRQFAEKHGLNLESITPMPLEGEGTIERRVTKLYDDLLKHPQWLADLHRADVVLVATHSQGSIVSTHLIARLISDGHIRTRSNREAVNRATEQTGVLPPIAPHRVCCLAMCGIHMGPLYSLNSSSLAQPYLQWFESQAARELFEFQDTESEVSRNYVAALSTALDHGTKFVYIASLNDQVVPIYSGTFVAASHPLILRGLFLDGDAYSSSDFLSNLLVLLLRVKNAGLDEHGLVVHLSEATAGSLSGIGHSTAYEDFGPYTLAVRYMFETSDLAPEDDCKLSVDAFQARASRNDYEIPWLLHSVISDTRISRVFSAELAQLRDSFADWKPTTAVLRDIQRKLAPIRVSPLRHSTVAPAPQEPVNSKL